MPMKVLGTKKNVQRSLGTTEFVSLPILHPPDRSIPSLDSLHQRLVKFKVDSETFVIPF